MCAFLFGKDKKTQPKKDPITPIEPIKKPDQTINKNDDKNKSPINEAKRPQAISNVIPEKNKDDLKQKIKPEPKKEHKIIKEEKSLLQEVYSMIGKSIRIKGELTGADDIFVEGYVEGKIQLEKSLKVGETGVIAAEIHAKLVTISGKVDGNIHALDKIELLNTANVKGNLFSNKIAIAEGAIFQGKVDMSGSDKVEKVQEKKQNNNQDQQNEVTQKNKDIDKTKGLV